MALTGNCCEMGHHLANMLDCGLLSLVREVLLSLKAEIGTLTPLHCV